jgi:hypothetical protein
MEDGSPVGALDNMEEGSSRPQTADGGENKWLSGRIR